MDNLRKENPGGDEVTGYLGVVLGIAAVVGSVFLAWCAIQLAGLALAYNAPFPTWAVAIAAGVAMRFAALAYRRERRLVSPRRGRALVALRVAAIALVAFMLLQPTLLKTRSRRIERTVAVLVDTSDSMRFDDGGWTPSERLSLANEAGLVRSDSLLAPSLEPLDYLARRLDPWLSADLAAGKAPPAYRKLVSQSRATARRLSRECASEPLASATNPVLRAFSRRLSTTLLPALEALAEGGPREGAAEALSVFTDDVAAVRAAADEAAWHALPTQSVARIAAFVATNRLSLALGVLTNSLPDLPDDYGVSYFSIGRHPVPTSLDALAAAARGEMRDEAQATATDYAAALEGVLAAVPSEELAGVLMLTDGLDNGDASVEPVARRLGSRGVRVSTVLVGGSTPPRDLALADISAPESVFLGDKVRVRAKVSATGARGSKAKVSLLLDGEKVDETTIPVSEDFLVRDFSLAHAPTNRGLARYELRIDEVEGERFPSNNAWKVDVAVSDDRTNVLLVDDYPRWDFRYLRNLFYARDKSVHLQYLLFHPDTILDADVTNRPPAASAARPFGEAEASALPENEAEWRKFDAIILGDVGPDVVTPEVQRTIAACVEERGALLVVIAGPRAMPHAYPEDAPLRALLPCVFPASSGDAGAWEPPERSYAIALTPSGRQHPVTQQSSSATENEQLWQSLPRCTWRFPVSDVKAGAEVIAYAAPEEDEAAPAVTAASAAGQIDAERALRARRAVIVAQSAGRGKVLQLNTDESWRLRYRVGDTRHHRFWGQVVRWGLGERLRGGTARLRVGTDRLTYTPHDGIRLLARVLDASGAPVADAAPVAVVEPLPPAGASTNAAPAAAAAVPAAHRVPLAYVADSQGLYEAMLPPLVETGAYRLSIESPGSLSGEGDDREVATTFFVAASRRPIEMAAVAARRDVPDALARWTGGRVVMPHEARTLSGAFGEKSRVVTEPLEISLWDNPWLLAALLATLVAEWVIRKVGGLV